LPSQSLLCIINNKLLNTIYQYNYLIMFEQFFPVKDPVLIFALLMLIALLAPLLSAKLNLPGIIGLIVTGIVLGPHALGILERAAEIELLGMVGLLYIMFLAGLELDRIQFIHHRNHSLGFGLLTFSIPLFFGSLMTRYILGFSWPAAILLSSCFSSHTLITYPIASRLGLSRQRAVTTTIGGTIFTDTAALLVLAVIAASYKGESGFFWPQLFFFMIVYVAAVVFILPKLSRWFFRNIATDGVIAFTGVLAAVFLCAYLAYLAGFEPIIGAFIAGLILNSFIPEKSTLMTRIQFVGHSLFIPFFLISVGMLVDVKMLFSTAETMMIAAVMVFAALTTKWGAAYPTQRLLKYTPDEGRLIYGLSVNQAAATLAAVLVGYNIGIFEEPVLTGTVIMILVTSMVGSWVTDRYARRVALREEEEPYQASDTPHRVLVPLANPKTVEELMNLAMLFRRRNSHEPIYPLTIVQSGDKVDERIAKAEKLLGQAVVQALEGDIPVTPTTRAAIDTPVGILQAIVDLRISTIVAGWQGKSTSQARAFGRILDTVLENSTQMMFISRCPVPLNTMKRVVVAVPPLIDHQPGFVTAIGAIKTLIHQLDSSMLMVSVSPTMEKAKKVMENTLPKVQEKDIQLNSWKDLLVWLKKSLDDNDLLIVVSVRKGRLAWQPNLNRLPRLLSQQFPEINQVIVYPPDRPWGEVIDMHKGKVFHPSFLPADHIQLDLSRVAVSEAIYRLLAVAFSERPEVLKRVSGLLSRMADEEPMELSPGVVLLHAHISDVQTSTVFLGINKKGWKLSQTTEDVKVLFILLSSKDASPEVHLKALADLVRPLHQFKAAEQLTNLSSPDEILELFYGNK
jgi:Kef-type K+ transport system membrane component KefB/mannitol/fructose-specific phosphotransferase system IIA component (Ntr-type)